MTIYCYEPRYGGRLKMRLLRRVLIVSMLMSVLVVQFTNCQVQPQVPLDDGSDGEGCEDASCAPPSDALSITTPGSLLVASTALTAEFGGSCTIGTFPVGAMGWRLWSSCAPGRVELTSCVQFDGACGVCNAGNYSFAGATAVYFPGAPQTGWCLEVEIQGYIPAVNRSWDGLPGKSKKTFYITTP